ncbi:MAG: imidazolonepropionase [Myxococcales bacterium]|nr:imidazolonepropionase [Myxococcales bacterium]
MSHELLLKNVGRLVTMQEAKDREGVLGVICDAALLIKDGKISWLGKNSEEVKVGSSAQILDLRGRVVMPGLVDCHTHLVHSGSRQLEFNMRSKGMSYQQIARSGGGIVSTVTSTRETSIEDLYSESARRADEALQHGTTTMEIKTGYGLDFENEIKIADAIGLLHEKHPMDVMGTFLGAHIVPPEFAHNRSKYIDMLLDEMMPEMAARKWMTSCDVFIEEIAFNEDEARRICASAKRFGLAIHLHVDQFSSARGGEIAAEFGALSADHLDKTSDSGVDAMVKSGVVGVLLPGASFFSGGGSYPDARRMIDRGLVVAIATDYNPGTNPSLDLFLTASIAITQMKMTCDEALLAITKNAARALGLSDRGVIEKGARGDFIVLDAPDEYYPLYRYGANLVSHVYIGGREFFHRK